MRIPHRHLRRREAERLLDDPAAHRSALGTLLAAAGAPAEPDELRREEATAAVFHRTAMAPSPGGSQVLVPAPRRGGRAATRAVVATGAVVAMASGGFALAGSADLPQIPGLPGQASDRATESVARTPTSSEASTSSTTSEGQTTATGGPGASQSGRPGPPGPTPNLEGLCRAFQATDHSAHGSSLDSAAFAALTAAATAAGDAVATYCIDLIGEPKPTGKASVRPTPTSKPTPSNPTDKPTGKASVRPTPTSKPTPTKPTGSPTSQPTPAGKPRTTSGKPNHQPSSTDKGGGRRP